MVQNSTYTVIVSRCGSVRVIAESAQQAMDIANQIPATEITWDDDFMPTDSELSDDEGSEA